MPANKQQPAQVAAKRKQPLKPRQTQATGTPGYQKSDPVQLIKQAQNHVVHTVNGSSRRENPPIRPVQLIRQAQKHVVDTLNGSCAQSTKTTALRKASIISRPKHKEEHSAKPFLVQSFHTIGGGHGMYEGLPICELLDMFRCFSISLGSHSGGFL